MSLHFYFLFSRSTSFSVLSSFHHFFFLLLFIFSFLVIFLRSVCLSHTHILICKFSFLFWTVNSFLSFDSSDILLLMSFAFSMEYHLAFFCFLTFFFHRGNLRSVMTNVLVLTPLWISNFTHIITFTVSLLTLLKV